MSILLQKVLDEGLCQESPSIFNIIISVQGLKLALANSQNASENQNLRVQSASLSHFFASSTNNRKQSILANLTHN